MEQIMLNFLGTGGAFNVKRGNNSAYFIFQKELFLFDCGEDVFQKLIKKQLFQDIVRVNIFITHLHSDHVGSLGTTIAYLYFNVFHQEMSNICIYFPSEQIAQLLDMQGISRDWYNLFINRWDELFIPGIRKQPEYSFVDTVHVKEIEDTFPCFGIEFILENQFAFYYSGDTCEYPEKLKNLSFYDFVYLEVTMNQEADVHLFYEQLLQETKQFSKEEKAKIYLMHLDSDFDVERAYKDGFQVAENCL